MKQITIIAALALSLVSGAVAALEYRTDKPLAFTYKNKRGNWFGCGPTQCLLASEKTEERAFDLIDGYRNGPWKLIGRYGRCKVYQGDGPLDGSDNSPEWVVQRLTEKRNGKTRC